MGRFVLCFVLYVFVSRLDRNLGYKADSKFAEILLQDHLKNPYSDRYSESNADCCAQKLRPSLGNMLQDPAKIQDHAAEKSRGSAKNYRSPNPCPPDFCRALKSRLQKAGARTGSRTHVSSSCRSILAANEELLFYRTKRRCQVGNLSRRKRDYLDRFSECGCDACGAHAYRGATPHRPRATGDPHNRARLDLLRAPMLRLHRSADSPGAKRL